MKSLHSSLHRWLMTVVAFVLPVLAFAQAGAPAAQPKHSSGALGLVLVGVVFMLGFCFIFFRRYSSDSNKRGQT